MLSLGTLPQGLGMRPDRYSCPVQGSAPVLDGLSMLSVVRFQRTFWVLRPRACGVSKPQSARSGPAGWAWAMARSARCTKTEKRRTSRRL